MKKILFFIFALVLSFTTANAQIATENQKIMDNTYIGINSGVATPLSFDNVFPLNPVVSVRFGKEFTPVWGAELEGDFWFGSNASNAYPTNRFDFNGFNTHNALRGTYVGVNGTVNLMNLFAGYNGTPRFFEIKTIAGLGWNHTFIANGGDINGLGAKTGLDLNFNLGKNKAHTISITPAVLWNLQNPFNNKIQFNSKHAQLYLGIGYTYHFKTSNGTHHFKTYDVGAMTDEIARLNDELAKKPKVVTREKVVEKVVEKPVTEHATGFGVKETVFFAFDSAELDDNAKATLDNLGQNGIYVVRGYASSEGSTEYNKALSQRRADAVAEYLRSRGARVDKAEGLGVVFGPTTGRVAVVTVE